METIKTFFKSIFGAGIVIAIMILTISLTNPKISLGDTATTPIKVMNVSTGPTVSGTSSTVLAASSGRVYAVFVNDGAVPIYLSLNGVAAVANKGIRLNASGGSYEINLSNQYVGAVNAITSSSTAVLTVTASQ